MKLCHVEQRKKQMELDSGIITLWFIEWAAGNLEEIFFPFNSIGRFYCACQFLSYPYKGIYLFSLVERHKSYLSTTIKTTKRVSNASAAFGVIYLPKVSKNHRFHKNNNNFLYIFLYAIIAYDDNNV
ncbi:hypothetical protein ACJX0J_016606, partial [Zea mays]